MTPPSWRTLTEIDLRFSRSRRVAAARRREPTGRAVRRRSVRVLVLSGTLFAALGVVGGLQVSGVAPIVHSAQARPRALAAPCPIPTSFRNAFAAASRDTNLPLSLLAAVAYEESRMDPAARSTAGAQGLLQLMPATAHELALESSAPDRNVLAGARYLRQLLDRFGGSVDLALAAYNAGPTVVEQTGAAPTSGTLTYVANVKARAAKLAAAASALAAAASCDRGLFWSVSRATP